MSKSLLLIPTEFERKLILPIIEQLESDSNLEVTVQLCGFGPVAAAARTASLVARHRPRQVILLGIAGSYCDRAIGEAFQFSSVGCYGVGVGTGETFQTAQKMGWPHWVDEDAETRIGDVISISGETDSGQLLTVCAASENPNDVRRRQAAFPEAVAEDMEGFGVALACQLAETSLTIIRGISNVAGDRDKSNWKVEAAMAAAGRLVQQVING